MAQHKNQLWQLVHQLVPQRFRRVQDLDIYLNTNNGGLYIRGPIIVWANVGKHSLIVWFAT